MLNKLVIILLFSAMVGFTWSCSPKNISTNYYYQHEKVLDRMEESYKKLNQQKPFSIAFTDRKLDRLTLEIITDTLSYIYQFDLHEKRLTDSLLAHQYDAVKVVELIQQMKSVRCTWINNLNYFVDDKKNSLIFMTIKPVVLSTPFSAKKYYSLAYFPRQQFFDSSGQLLDKRKLTRLRKINGEIFKRINDKVCYTISEKFR